MQQRTFERRRFLRSYVIPTLAAIAAALRPGGLTSRLGAALRHSATLGAGTAIAPVAGFGQPSAVLTRPIPSSGEAIPVVGLGSWITFNVGNDRVARDQCADVMRNFFDA